MEDTAQNRKPPETTFEPGSGTTAITRNSNIRLGQLSSSAGTSLRRIIPQGETPKPPVAAFDSAM